MNAGRLVNDEDGRGPVSDRDGEVLAFAAAHRFVLASHIHILLKTSERDARGRLAALEEAGLVRHECALPSEPRCYQITRSGLVAIGSDLPPRQLDLRSYRKDVGVAWLWLAARDGVFGEADRVLSNLELRSLDQTRTVPERPEGRSESGTLTLDRDEPPFGVSVHSSAPGVAPRLHYPDLMVIIEGHRIAIELALSMSGQRRVEQILEGYRAEPSIAVALYLVDDDLVSRSIRTPAAALGISDRIHVQGVQLAGAGGKDRAASPMTGGEAAATR